MKKTILQRIQCLLFSLVLILSVFNVLPVQAAGETKITFGEVMGQNGNEVTVPVTISENSGIATFRFRISYDTEGLTFVSAEKGSLLTTGTLQSAVDDENETVTFLWFSPTNVSGDGEIAKLKFRISDTAKGEYPLKVTHLAEDLLNENREQVTYKVQEGKILTGSTVSGTITCFGDVNEAVTVKLLENNVEVAARTTTNGRYQFDSVSSGTYNLVVAKKDHATRTYEIIVKQEDVIQDVKIHLLGDINGDGRVRTFDYTKALAHVRGTTLLEGYEFQCADVNGDGRVRTFDYTKMLAHVRGTALLW